MQLKFILSDFNVNEELKDILKIDNLWSFENLTKLQLDNNIIEKIENLDFLKNLKWLGKPDLIEFRFII